MIVQPIKTDRVTNTGNLTEFIDRHVSKLPAQSVLVITSKIVSILEGSVAPKAQDKKTLIQQDADLYIDASESKYDVTLTIKNHTLIANAGIDESNANDTYILWPKDPFTTAATVWNHLRKKHAISELGIIITDSRQTPFRWGSIGLGLAWCGFQPLKSYIGTPDIFGRPFIFQTSSVVDGLAASAVVVMGEGSEQTPLATITDIPFVQFTDRAPTQADIAALRIEPKDDLFAPLLTAAKWQKGTRE